MLKDGLDLASGHAREPLHKLIQVGAVLEVLEQGRDGNTGSFEYPRATHLFRVAFDLMAI